MGGIFGGGDDAADAATEAADIQAQAQREALDYLKEKERVPSWYSDQALGQLAGYYGLDFAPDERSLEPEFISSTTYAAPSTATTGIYAPGGFVADARARSGLAPMQTPTTTMIPNPNYRPATEGQQYADQGQFIEGVKADPFYQSMIGQGEEAVLRNQAATGGLRSGAASESLAQNSQNVLQGLVNQKLAGLRGFTGSSGLEGSIASQMAGVGTTQAQGITAAAQAQQVASQNTMSNLLGIGGIAAGAGAFTGLGGFLGGLF